MSATQDFVLCVNSMPAKEMEILFNDYLFAFVQAIEHGLFDADDLNVLRKNSATWPITIKALLTAEVYHV